MDTCRKIHILTCCLLISLQSAPAFAQFRSSYNYYIDLSRQAVAKRDYQSLLFYVESAHLADPAALEPFDLLKELPIYQNNINILKGYLLQAVQALERKATRSALFYFELSLLVTPDDALIKEYIDYVNRLIKGLVTDEKPLIERIKKEYKIELPVEADIRKLEKEEAAPVEIKQKEVLSKARTQPKRETAAKKAPAVAAVPKREAPEQRATTMTLPAERIVKHIIVLDQDLWRLQPNTTIEIEFHKSLIMEGRNIERFLALDQDYIVVERLDKDRIQLTSIRRGTTIFHVWDDTGRWTFNIKGVLPDLAQPGFKKPREELWEEYVQPFRLRYSNNWSSFYEGNSPRNLARRTLIFTQRVGTFGETPYGEFDASANFYRFTESTENTGRAIGLTNGKIGPFKDFTLRGFDTYKRFSTLSLPGRSFRGGKIDAYAFDHKILYSYIRGQDRANFETISEAVIEIKKSYLEGARLTLFPDTIHQYSLNFARGWGEARSPSLKEKVFSFDTEHQLGALNVTAETAYDEDVHAHLINTKYEQENYSLRINARDINKDFTTITSRPSGQGITGGNIVFDWDPQDGINFSSNLDIYQNHDIPNPDDPHALNYDIGTFLNVPLAESLSWNSSAYYSDSPQLISPRTSTNVNTSLNKSFQITPDKALATFIGATFQRSRFEFSPESEYDRTTLRAGFRFPIFKRLSYFLNYDYSFVDVVATGEESTPSVMTTGLSYNRTFWDKLSTHASVSYRDEEQTEGQFSFLSGTDILRTNLGLSYRPTPDYEIFVDGNFRNVWSESDEAAAFNDADVRFGLRAYWDLFFAWNPQATISGFAFKDLNRNGVREAHEPGIPDIRVRVGNKIAITNRHGFYTKEIRARSIKVAVKTDSIPQGHSLTNEASTRVEIEQGKRVSIDFGFSVRTEIYGIVFVDENNNGLYDLGETTIPGARILLDGEDSSLSDFEGIYAFYELTPGEHTLKLDVNSVPLEFIPKIKLSNTIVLTEGSSYSFNIPLKTK